MSLQGNSIYYTQSTTGTMNTFVIPTSNPTLPPVDRAEFDEMVALAQWLYETLYAVHNAECHDPTGCEVCELLDEADRKLNS